MVDISSLQLLFSCYSYLMDSAFFVSHTTLSSSYASCRFHHSPLVVSTIESKNKQYINQNAGFTLDTQWSTPFVQYTSTWHEAGAYTGWCFGFATLVQENEWTQMWRLQSGTARHQALAQHFVSSHGQTQSYRESRVRWHGLSFLCPHAHCTSLFARRTKGGEKGLGGSKEIRKKTVVTRSFLTL
jgi:hypothetical protein